MKNKNYTLVSLFSGAGGLDLGFEQAGFKTLWANDINKDACKTHEMWSTAKVVCGDISKIDFNTIPDSDVIAGGFPCQGFSLAGPRKIDDSRNILYKYFVKLVEAKKPKVFIAENVRGILSLGDGEIIKAILCDFESKGYEVSVHMFNVCDYEVPQDRIRIIIVGVRKDIEKDFIPPEKSENVITLKNAIKNIEFNDCDLYDGSYSSRYMSRNRKRNWDEFSFTIPAQARQTPLHPSSPDMIKICKDKYIFGNGITRRLTYKECAAIQTFPPAMLFYGDLMSRYMQIGNAVPVRFAEFLALSIKNILE